MKKSELRNGMIVELRNHGMYMVMLDTMYNYGEFDKTGHSDILVRVNKNHLDDNFTTICNSNGFMSLDNYDEDLNYGGVDDDDGWSIMKVYGYKYCGYIGVSLSNYSYPYNKLFVDLLKKKMTVAEIEEELGYSIEIIDK